MIINRTNEVVFNFLYLHLSPFVLIFALSNYQILIICTKKCDKVKVIKKYGNKDKNEATGRGSEHSAESAA